MYYPKPESAADQQDEEDNDEEYGDEEIKVNYNFNQQIQQISERRRGVQPNKRKSGIRN